MMIFENPVKIGSCPKSMITAIMVGVFVFLSFSLIGSNYFGNENDIIHAFAQQTQSDSAIRNNSVIKANLINDTLILSKDSGDSTDDRLINLYDKVDQSVVQVTHNSDTPGDSRLGSGFVYDELGHIITNYHVVSGKNINAKFDITFIDGTAYEAEVIGVDPFAEIAVLKISLQNISQVKEKLVPLPIGNFSKVDVGQRVAAVGNPFGLSASITEGIVSGLGRLLPALSPEMSQTPLILDTPSFSIPNIIQTDAAINPGNSGGPLLNMNGEVIGINTAIFSSTGVYSGVGFAIPSYLIQQVVPALITTGSYQHSYLGISGTDVNTGIAEIMGLENTTGFLVIQVTSGSPAEKSGIRGGSILTEIDGMEIELGGDVIIGVDDSPIRKIDDLLSYLEREKKVGENITLSVIRAGQVQQIDVTLAARPTPPALGIETIQGSQDNRPTLGISGIQVTPEIALQMKVPANILENGKGFLVIDVVRNGSAENAGIRGGYISSNIGGAEIELGGDIILEIDNTIIKSVEDIRKVLSTKQIGDTIQLEIYRDNKTLTIPVTLKGEPQRQQGLGEREIPGQSPSMPGQPPSPFQPFNPFGDSRNGFYEQCVQVAGKEICDRLFGR
ncbi:MAG: PDZ domain-containing protein [Candidatus Nitrosocosmicus sp.]|nr:PDZ domain-containing protein [Candidatus Nitrosocosmicus sp.]MDN5868075.1 PDZ domain-containing protein [Candidatus Nitrosocosmicus sp.]